MAEVTIDYTLISARHGVRVLNMISFDFHNETLNSVIILLSSKWKLKHRKVNQEDEYLDLVLVDSKSCASNHGAMDSPTVQVPRKEESYFIHTDFWHMRWKNQVEKYTWYHYILEIWGLMLIFKNLALNLKDPNQFKYQFSITKMSLVHKQ